MKNWCVNRGPLNILPLDVYRYLQIWKVTTSLLQGKYKYILKCDNTPGIEVILQQGQNVDYHHSRWNIISCFKEVGKSIDTATKPEKNFGDHSLREKNNFWKKAILKEKLFEEYVKSFCLRYFRYKMSSNILWF